MLEAHGKKRKPVSTWSGHMLSVYTDLVEGFPVNEYEDLCKKCIRVINGSSSDLNPEMSGYDKVEKVLNDSYDDEVLDGAFEYTQHVYEGYRD
jgi:hypothetical protein